LHSFNWLLNDLIVFTHDFISIFGHRFSLLFLIDSDVDPCSWLHAILNRLNLEGLSLFDKYAAVT
jgi:hypothetical protein